MSCCPRGCTGNTVSTIVHPYPFTLTDARGALQDVGASGPVLLEVRSNPFPEDAAPPIAEAASHAAPTIRGEATIRPSVG
jgi:hypothetical protein